MQIALSTTGHNEQQVQGSVTDVVARINARFSTLTYQPIVFLHTQDLTFTQYLALLTVADAFIVTSLREGMVCRDLEGYVLNVCSPAYRLCERMSLLNARMKGSDH